MNLVALTIAVIGGISAGIQGPVNASLGRVAGSLRAGSVSFIGSWIIVSISFLINGLDNIPLVFSIPWWQWFGGLYGVFICVSITFVVPILGAGMTVVVLQFSQVISGMIIDSFGWFQVSPMETNWIRIVGCSALALGAFCFYLDKRKITAKDSECIEKVVNGIPKDRKCSFKQMVGILVMVIAGVCGAIQSPTNAALAQTIGRWEAMWISYTVSLFVILSVVLCSTGGKRYSLQEMRPWQFTGGLFGVIGAFCFLVATPELGAGLVVAGNMTGQFTVGMILDSRGWLQCHRIHTTPLRWLGLLSVMIGIIMTAIARFVM